MVSDSLQTLLPIRQGEPSTTQHAQQLTEFWSVKELENRVEKAQDEKKVAEEGLERHKAQVAPTRAKIEALGQRFMSLQESNGRLEAALQHSKRRWASECKAREALDPRLKTAEDRIKELEACSLLVFFSFSKSMVLGCRSLLRQQTLAS